MEGPGVPVQRGLQGAQGNPYVGLVFVAAAAVAIGVALCLLHRRVTRQFEERHGYQHGPDHHDQLGKLGSMVRDLAEGVSFKLGTGGWRPTHLLRLRDWEGAHPA